CMQLAKSTNNWLAVFSGLILTILSSFPTLAQENSPYSRYGLGDIVPNQNVVNRGMGGLSIAVPN
ncbi:MAG TPA: hypothetical protein PKW54_10550, partial [Ferruginibacter sp.]|nr:hypothetical protein [Ferruginibacter sp.]